MPEVVGKPKHLDNSLSILLPEVVDKAKLRDISLSNFFARSCGQAQTSG